MLCLLLFLLFHLCSLRRSCIFSRCSTSISTSIRCSHDFNGINLSQKIIEDKAGKEVLRRIFGGQEISKAEYHGKYYRNALKAKTYIKEQFEKIFEDVDFLIIPTVPKTAHKFGEKISVKEMYAYDVLTIPANLTGLPAISIPCEKVEEKPIGLQIMTRKFEENLLFKVAKEFEQNLSL